MSSPIRVVVADDQPLIRSGFAALIASAPDLEVVGEAADGVEALDLVRARRPDVVVLDIRMPRADGLATTRAITADPELESVRVLVLTTFETDDHIAEALRAGASGFVGKDIDPARLLDAVRTVAAGEALLSPAATRSLIHRYLAAPETAVPEARIEGTGLTPRELEVVALVAQGLDNAEIAEHLVVSPLTAKTHVTRAIGKLGVRDRAQLVVWAYRSGLMDGSPEGGPRR
ncbi:response regulator transcription factor [Nocardioides fonticola]|uniref:Response regulator transcription factor n=1 Tax=Nocardioides fonticola TaxID=450363 RepID=A0ABP7XCC6_9ACTN